VERLRHIYRIGLGQLSRMASWAMFPRPAQAPAANFVAARERKDRKDEKMKTDINELCGRVRQTAYEIHVYHGHGHLEKVYENALAHRLRKLGLDIKQQHPLKVYDEDGTLIGEYAADLLVDNRLIVELKAAKTLADEHVAQVLGYLKSSRVEHGLLINFGSYKFEINEYALSAAKPQGHPGGILGLFSALSAFFCG
jgi:GxxExxY protein